MAAIILHNHHMRGADFSRRTVFTPP